MRNLRKGFNVSFNVPWKVKFLTASVAMLLFFLAGSPAFSQAIQWGVKAGVPATDYFQTISALRQGFASSTNRYTVGPTIEVSLPYRLGIELDALYKRYHYSGSGTSIDVVSQEKTTANSWEFPVLLKYRLTEHIIHPFVDAGLSLHRISDVKQVRSILVIPSRIPFVSATDNPAELSNRFNAGFVMGGGLEFKVPFVRISPEIRYTRWGSQNFRSPTGLLNSSQNQVEFMVGFTF